MTKYLINFAGQQGKRNFRNGSLEAPARSRLCQLEVEERRGKCPRGHIAASSLQTYHIPVHFSCAILFPSSRHNNQLFPPGHRLHWLPKLQSKVTITGSIAHPIIEMWNITGQRWRIGYQGNSKNNQISYGGKSLFGNTEISS